MTDVDEFVDLDDAGDSEVAATAFEDVDAWVDEWLVRTYLRSCSTIRIWCRGWREHPEAVARLSALWLAWEATAISSSRFAWSDWWLHHLDPHMAVLMDPAGPFQGCSVTEGHSGHAGLSLGDGG